MFKLKDKEGLNNHLFNLIDQALLNIKSETGFIKNEVLPLLINAVIISYVKEIVERSYPQYKKILKLMITFSLVIVIYIKM